MEKVKTYLEGLGLLLILVIFGIIFFIVIGFIELSIFIILLIIFIGIVIVALISTPYYYAKNFKVKSKDFKLKKIKKREKL